MRKMELQWRCAGVALALMALLAGQATGDVTFTLDNQSDVVVERVQAGPDYDGQWEEDLLGSAVLPPGSRRQFEVEAEPGHCMFDVRVHWSGGLRRAFMGRDFCEDARVVFDGGRGLIIKNESDTTIAVVKASPDYESSWGEDRLGEDFVLPGREYVVMFEDLRHCTYDIQLTTVEETYDSETQVQISGWNLCDNPTLAFHGNQLTIVNEGEDLYFIRVSLDHDSQGWGEDLLGIGVLSHGEEMVASMHQFKKDQCLIDVLVADADDRQHVYEGVDICEGRRLLHPQDRATDDPTPAAVPQENFAPGDTFRDCESGCPWMAVVNGGEFERGSWDRDEETPVTNVTVPGPFAVGQYEVSVGQFEEFVRDTDHDGGNRCHVRQGSRWRLTDGRNWRNPGFDQDDSHPVVCVSWDDAVAYTNWLAERTRVPYRLLTEAEAELLARASAMNFERSDRANCRGCGSQRDERSTSPVGRLPDDRLGLSGVFGNASEWMQDCYQSGYSNAPRDGSAWAPQSCQERVVRGGCWATRAQELRASGRDHGRSNRRSSCVGFRVARDLGQ